VASEAPDKPRFFALQQATGGRHDAHCHAVEPVRGEAPRCHQCGNFIGMLTWRPPFRVELELYGEAHGDFIAAPGNGLLISERFADAFHKEALTGLSGFHSVEVISVRKKRQCPKPSSVPSYLFVTPAFGSAAVDEARSRIQHQRTISCDWCREAGVRAIHGFCLEERSWNGDDIFRPRGLPGRLVVSERFVGFVQAHGLTNMQLTPTEELRHDYYAPRPLPGAPEGSA
jgi:hypothetical protein